MTTNDAALSGTLIAVEGIDGSGKSTLVGDLSRELASLGREIVVTKEPGGTDFGKHLLDILHKDRDWLGYQAEFLLFATDRSHHFQSVVVPALERGAIVLSDRLADSSLAYQAHGRGLNREMVDRINRWAMSDIQPDLVFYLHLTYEQASKRIRQRQKALSTFEKEQQDFWQRVIAGYDKELLGRESVITIDASQTQEAVYAEAVEKLKEWMEMRR